MKPILLLITCFIIHYAAYSQGNSSSIKGMVNDSASSEPLEQASVSLIRLSDSYLVRQSLSGKTGFEFRRIANGTYLLTVSFIGYKPDTTRIIIDNNSKTTYTTGTIKLSRSSGDLMEVVVRSVIPPVIVKNDTIVYNANAVATQPNATIEDLIKKLPGFEVDKNGNITLHGQKVEKIYIDGKEFFLNDPKLATQNLTADMIDAIEAFDNQSERAKASGIKDVDANKALNLRLKKDRKKGLFGNAIIRAGTQNNYTLNGTATYFKTDRWIFGSLSANYADNLSSGAGIKQSGTGQGINYRDNLSKKAQLVVNYNGSNNRNQSGQSSSRETLLGDSSLLQNRRSLNDNRSKNYGVNFNLTYTIDSMSTFVYSPTVSWQNNKSFNSDTSFINVEKKDDSYLSNEGKTMNTMFSDGYTYSNNVSYRKRFRKRGRSFSATFIQNYQQQTQDGKLYSSLKLYDSTGALIENRVVDQQYVQKNKNSVYGLNVYYTEPINKSHIIDFGYSLNTSTGTSGKKAFNYDPNTHEYDEVDTLTTNQFTNSNTRQNFSIGYNFIGKKVQYQVGASMLHSTLTNESENEKFETIDQHVINWSPRASAFYRLAPQKNLRIQYNGNSMAPTTQMLQPIPDLSNPYLIRIGNPDLKQQFQHNVSINYNGSNSKKFTNLILQLGGNITSNKIVQSSVIKTAGIQELKYVNVNGVYAMNSNASYGFSINKSKNGGGNVSARFQYNRDVNFINGKQNVRQGFNWGPAVNLHYNVKDKLYTSLNASVSYNRSNYSIGSDLNTQQFSQNYGTNITYVLPLSIRLSSDFNLNIIGKQRSLPGRTIAMWNASVFRNIFRSNKGEIRFSAFDLLNRNTGFNQTIGDNFIETRETNVLQRYFTLSFRYNFRVSI